TKDARPLHLMTLPEQRLSPRPFRQYPLRAFSLSSIPASACIPGTEMFRVVITQPNQDNALSITGIMDKPMLIANTQRFIPLATKDARAHPGAPARHSRSRFEAPPGPALAEEPNGIQSKVPGPGSNPSH